nr:hypothetical protein [Micromonospora sp. DSM 115978]
VADSEILIRTKLLRQFQSARQLDLLLFIDSVRFGEGGQEVPEVAEWSSEFQRSGRYTNNMTGQPFTRFLGTKVIPPASLEKCGIWPYDKDEDQNYPEFIIGVDVDGDDIRHTCNPAALANYFGLNPGALNYLTPVAFRREVLQKYYDRPELYTVDDGHLFCASLWSLKIDNNADGAVVVFLGDLGRDLPHQERGYWQSFNILPDVPLSAPAFSRAFLGQGTEPTATDLRVRSAYARLREAWSAEYGWDLFRKPEEADSGLLKRLRLPLNDSQTEFETSIRILAQLMCDAINERAIQAELPDQQPNEKGISKLERWLRGRGYSNIDRDVKFLRNLQELRSKVTAHRKGSDYEKTLSKIFGNKRGTNAITQLFEEAIVTLKGLQDWASTNTDGK